MAPPRTTTEPMSTTCHAQHVTLVGTQSGRGLRRIRISRQIWKSVNILVQGIKIKMGHNYCTLGQKNLKQISCVHAFMCGPLSTRWLILGFFPPDKPKDHPNATRHLPICTAGRIIVPVAAQLERKQPACPKTARNHVLLPSILFYPFSIYKQRQQKHKKV